MVHSLDAAIFPSLGVNLSPSTSRPLSLCSSMKQRNYSVRYAGFRRGPQTQNFASIILQLLYSVQQCPKRLSVVASLLYQSRRRDACFLPSLHLLASFRQYLQQIHGCLLRQTLDSTPLYSRAPPALQASLAVSLKAWFLYPQGNKKVDEKHCSTPLTILCAVHNRCLSAVFSFTPLPPIPSPFPPSAYAPPTPA